MSDKKEFKAEIKAKLSISEIGLIIICGIVVYNIIKNATEIESIMRVGLCICFGVLPPAYIIVKNIYLASRTHICVNSTMVTGEMKRLFSKQNISLPLDNISSLGIERNTSYGGKIVTIATASGVIRFPWVQNAEEFIAATNAFMEEHRKKSTTERRATVVSTALHSESQSNVTKLKELKELLDSGLISQEEFEQKRKELLNNM